VTRPPPRPRRSASSPPPKPASRAPRASSAGSPRPMTTSDELRDPLRRMERFEEMRDSEESINSAILSRVALILASTWKLSSASDDAQSRERLEFVEDNLYPLLEQLLRHLYEAVHYGFGLVEPVLRLGRSRAGAAGHARQGAAVRRRAAARAASTCRSSRTSASARSTASSSPSAATCSAPASGSTPGTARLIQDIPAEKLSSGPTTSVATTSGASRRRATRTRRGRSSGSSRS
jgi:hypothetical protein